jgi:hypothetical protein
MFAVTGKDGDHIKGNIDLDGLPAMRHSTVMQIRPSDIPISGQIDFP